MIWWTGLQGVPLVVWNVVSQRLCHVLLSAPPAQLLRLDWPENQGLGTFCKESSSWHEEVTWGIWSFLNNFVNQGHVPPLQLLVPHAPQWLDGTVALRVCLLAPSPSLVMHLSQTSGGDINENKKWIGNSWGRPPPGANHCRPLPTTADHCRPLPTWCWPMLTE